MAENAFTKAISTLRASPVLASLVTASALGIGWAVRDFWEWKAFGTGGTPPTIAGYLRMTRFRIGRLLKHDDLNDASSLSTAGPQYLPPGLAPRSGPRPKIVSRTMPHRQVPEADLSPEPASRLHSLVRRMAAERPEMLEVRPSHTEGGTTEGLYATAAAPANPVAVRDRIIGREIAHVHPADNSLHVSVSEADARRLVELGWGQRFPLSFVPPGWIMIYAPRSAKEVEVVEMAVRAAVAWTTGVEM